MYKRVKLEQVVFVGHDFRNVRVLPGDTTLLQESMREMGEFPNEFPLQVIPHPNDPDLYICWNGQRRWTAAEKVGIKEVPILVSDIPLERLPLYALMTDTQEALPDVVLDDRGEVVGGKAWAVAALLQKNGDRPMTAYQIAKQTAMTVQDVSAYRDLMNDIREIKERVAAGELSVTGYYRVKRLSAAEKQQLLSRPGTLTIAYVQDWLRDRSRKTAVLPHPQGSTPPRDGAYSGAHLDEYDEEAGLEVQEEPEIQPGDRFQRPGTTEKPEFRLTNAVLINQAHDRLRLVGNPSPSDLHILYEVRQLVDTLIGSS